MSDKPTEVFASIVNFVRSWETMKRTPSIYTLFGRDGEAELTTTDLKMATYAYYEARQEIERLRERVRALEGSI